MGLHPTGILNSGVGGLTVARTIIDQFPEESITYIGDITRTPCGLKPIAQVHELVLDIMNSLADSGVKILVIACNSASAAVLHDACEHYQAVCLVPATEVIQPAVRCAMPATWNRRIGAIGTEATIGSGAYEDAFAAASHLTLTTAARPEFVELVEAGIVADPQVEGVVERYLAFMRDAGVDTLAFGCACYSLFVGATGYTVGELVMLVLSADGTARDVYAKLASRDLFAPPGNKPDRRLYVTGDPTRFGELVGRFLGSEVGAARLISQISSGVSA